MRQNRLVSIENQPMLIFKGPETISDHLYYKNKFYESDIFERWINYFPSSGLMLDIGANIGNHVVMFKNRFPDLKIWAFEPILDNFLLLKTNTEHFKDVSVFNVGVGSKTGMVNFDTSELSYNSGTSKITSSPGYKNLVIALDDVDFFNEPINFIKIDVEGHEYSCFEGMMNLLIKHKPIIWAEDYNEVCKITTNNSINLLQRIGYEVIYFEHDANFLLTYKQ
jgi:FkbM family methyltransferase